MDSITHIVLGAAIGEAVLGKKIGKKAMLWGALAGTIPDFDVLANPFMERIDSLFFHRGITHSLLFCIVVSLLLGFLFNRWYSEYSTRFRDWSLLFFLGILSHIILDTLTAYGTGIFEPFSDMRITFNVLFIADPFYTLPLLVSCIALLILKRDSARRKNWNKTAFVLSSLYLIFAITNKLQINALFERSLYKQAIVYDRYFTQPTPLNNFLWVVYAENESGYWTGYYSLFDKKRIIPFRFIEHKRHLLGKMESNPNIELLKKFTDDYYVITEKNDTLYFNAVQFGQFGGWYKEDAPFAFSFELGKEGEFNLQRGRWKSSSGEVFEKLVERVKGK